MADNRQFGSPKVLRFGDKTEGKQAGDSGHCGQCEAMLADALDGTLSPADQALFDGHVAHCGPCSQLLADARRGAAWLEMLRDPRPEPPAALLERILLQTSGAQATQAMQPADLPGAAFVPIAAPAYGGAASVVAGHARVVPFRGRVAAAVRASIVGQIMLQPRLAMTAAMAFLSIALTLDLTGVRLQDLRASDLRPASLKRDFYSADARVVQYYEGLRVVYELESRVHDLQSDSGDEAPRGAPTAVPDSSPSTNQSGGRSPAAQPGPAKSGPAAQPEQRQRPPASRPAPNSGTSRREDTGRALWLASANRCDGQLSGKLTQLHKVIPANGNDEQVERRLV